MGGGTVTYGLLVLPQVLTATLFLLLLQQQACQTLAQAPPWMAPPWMQAPFGQPNTNISGICDNVDCGKGKCVVESSNSSTSDGSSYSYSYSYSYGCKCESGWKSSDDGSHKYLPCVIPKCSFSSSCSQTFMDEKPKFDKLPTSPMNDSDPCQWAICGEGTCKKTSSFSYICDCKDGYSNLVNISSLPCFKDCKEGTGKQCEALGIGTLRTSSTPGSDGSDGSNGSTTESSVKLLWSFILMFSIIITA